MLWLANTDFVPILSQFMPILYETRLPGREGSSDITDIFLFLMIMSINIKYNVNDIVQYVRNKNYILNL